MAREEGRPTPYVGLVIALAAFASLHGVSSLRGPEAVVRSFHDDAFYYAAVARNVSQGEGLTFDGIHRTNGFHPLWLGALVPVFAMVEGEIAPLRIILLIQIAGWRTRRADRIRGPRSIWIAPEAAPWTLRSSWKPPSTTPVAENSVRATQSGGSGKRPRNPSQRARRRSSMPNPFPWKGGGPASATGV